MDSRGYLNNKTGGNGPSEQLLQLCRHILKKDIVANDPQLSLKIEERVKSNYNASILLLNKSQSAFEDTTIHEFTVAEKIKKYLVSRFIY